MAKSGSEALRRELLTNGSKRTVEREAFHDQVRGVVRTRQILRGSNTETAGPPMTLQVEAKCVGSLRPARSAASCKTKHPYCRISLGQNHPVGKTEADKV